MRKTYRNPMYDEVPEDWWTTGLCSLFANALRKRFHLPMYAVLERADNDGVETLIHAVVLKDNIAYDADGATPVPTLIAHYKPGLYYPDEPSRIIFTRITLKRLSDLHIEDVRDTRAALAFIDRHPERFAALRTSWHRS